MTDLLTDLLQEALARFEEVFARAREMEPSEPTAVILATADADGRPSARTVLLKGLDERGFVFYTNSRSRKGRDLRENPRAALAFFWQTVFEQVQVEGPVEPVSDEESDAYWATRRRESCIGAWASDQSAPLASREELIVRYAEHERRFAGGQVPRPPNWRGYRVVPDRIEFWRPGDHRLNERDCYERTTGGGWRRFLLHP